MAYIKIFGIKSTVKKAVDYITNPDKTDEQNLISSYGCSPETADLEFAMTAKLGKDNVMEKGDNLAWHMIISFKPGEITDPHIAHEVATKLKYNVDRAIWSSVSFDEFLMKMTESGYEIRKGKYLAFRAPEQKH